MNKIPKMSNTAFITLISLACGLQEGFRERKNGLDSCLEYGLVAFFGTFAIGMMVVWILWRLKKQDNSK